MIVCKDMNQWSGKFGNRIFCLNNTVQISKFFGHKFYCKKFKGSEIFVLNDQLHDIGEIEPRIDFKIQMDTLSDKNKVSLENNKNCLLDWCIHEFFFEYNQVSTHELFEYKKEFLESGIRLLEQMSLKASEKVSVHFRGNDFFLWDPNSLLPSSYYIKSIDELLMSMGENIRFNLFTDDYTLASFNETIRYLREKGISHSVSDGKSWVNDLIAMAHSDAIISSPSTFCILAGFTGKKEKKIIHSKMWVDNYRVKTDYFRDIFWKILLERGGDENYKLYKTI